jgi:hypothetical protein
MGSPDMLWAALPGAGADHRIIDGQDQLKRGIATLGAKYAVPA